MQWLFILFQSIKRFKLWSNCSDGWANTGWKLKISLLFVVTESSGMSYSCIASLVLWLGPARLRKLMDPIGSCSAYLKFSNVRTWTTFSFSAACRNLSFEGVNKTNLEEALVAMLEKLWRIVPSFWIRITAVTVSPWIKYYYNYNNL